MSIRLVTQLPLRTRARLRAEHHVDSIGAWLAGHGHGRAAVWLWRACRMI